MKAVAFTLELYGTRDVEAVAFTLELYGTRDVEAVAFTLQFDTGKLLSFPAGEVVGEGGNGCKGGDGVLEKSGDNEPGAHSP